MLKNQKYFPNKQTKAQCQKIHLQVMEKEKQQLLRSVQDSFQLLAFSVFDSFRKSPVNDNEKN